MHDRHLPDLGSGFWTALCFASVFGANMGDFFAHNLGLGHVKGLPFLALAFFLIIVLERFDRVTHEFWYWAAIVVVRTAATNLGDLLCGDFRLPRPAVIVALALVLAVVVTLAWNAWRRTSKAGLDPKRLVLSADSNYWVSMLIAGTLGTVMGDYFSHNLHLGNALASIVLALPLACFFLAGRRGRILQPALYWSTVAMVRAAGTTVGDFVAQRDMLGLALGTAVTGVAFLMLLVILRSRQVRAMSAGND
jgi:uncharacterized membrane-anchored protein